MIGHGPDAKYLARLLPQLDGIIDGFSFVNTDETNDCFNVIKAHKLEAKHKYAYYLDDITWENRKDFDFSKARNLALKNAWNLIVDNEIIEPFAMWLDCDDTIADPQKLLQAIIDNYNAAGLIFSYNVNAANANIRKIRLHRISGWQWINKVHEELRYTTQEKPELVVCPDVEIVHSPDDDKSNHEFHIELLKEGCRDAPNQYAYIGKEYFNRGNYEEALPWLLQTAQIHDWPNEKYIAWLYAGYIALNHLKDNDRAEEYLFKAVRAQPQRREAWFFLAQICVRIGDKRMREALAYISCCNAQIDEKQAMQNDLIYNRDCYLLHAEILLIYGLKKQAGQCLDKVKGEYRNDVWVKLAGEAGLTQ